MNIKDFLIDNYIWILVVILLSIVTIIGFLADKKRVKNKKDVNSTASNGTDAQTTAIPDNLNNPVNTGVNYQTNSNQQFDSLNMPLPQANINMQPTAPVEPVQAFNSQIVNTMPSPIEPVNTSPSPEPMYQPLSEQVPNFSNPEPTPSTIPYQSPAQPIPVVPSTKVPTEPVQPTNFVNQPSYNPQNIQTNEPYNNQFNQNNQINMVPNNNMVNSSITNNNTQLNNNYQGLNNMSTPSQMPYQSQPTNTIPTPIPSPVPVEPTHINNPEPSPAPTQPISFVYGPQNNQNNNQNM